MAEDDTKGLIVDQTIEKVSFCAPDRNHEKGFSYICRDGTTRRWMCHGFLASKDSGERLSHAVGCAFAVCLERKQKRDKECSVTMNFDTSNSTFTRTGSFRQAPLTERIHDPQDCKPPAEAVPVKPVVNPFAIERPHAAAHLLERQGSFRGLSQLNQSSPFKRQMSLRIGDLPSTVQRQQNSLSNEAPSYKSNLLITTPESPQPPPRVSRLHRIQPSPNHNSNMTPIPETSPMTERSNAVSAMCQQLSQGLSLLSSTDDPFLTGQRVPPSGSGVQLLGVDLSSNNSRNNAINSSNSSGKLSRGEQWLGSLTASVTQNDTTGAGSLSQRRPPTAHMRSASLDSHPDGFLPAIPPRGSPFHSPPPPPPPALINRSNLLHSDPFDADWALQSTNSGNTNPFRNNTVVKTFEVQM